MARKTTTRTLRILRTTLLLALVGFVALVYALYRFGKSGLPTDASDEPKEPPREELAVMEGQGFDYYITQGEETLARIRAQRLVSEEEDEIVLEGISPIELYREGDATYRIFADRGRYELDTQATELTSNVLLEGPEGLEVRSDNISVNHSNQRVASEEAVRFRMAGEFQGRASRMVAFLDRDIFILSQGVRVRSISPDREPVLLRSKRMTYHRKEHIVRAEGDVEFRRGDNYLRAERIDIHLTEDESSVLFISGRWGLKARLRQDYGQGVVRTAAVESDEFSVKFDPETNEPLEIELVGKTSGGATLRSTDEAAAVRTMTAPVIRGLFTDGELSHVEAWESVRIREYFAFASDLVLRWICAQRAVLDFDSDGEISEAQFDDRVVLRQGQTVAHGDRIEMSEEPFVLSMTGTPARFESEQGELTALRIVQEGEEGDVRATGGVRGLIRQESGSESLSIGGAKGPVRVESAEARWDRQTPSYKFEQNVRLWQDRNLLLAEEVETLADSDVVIARGGIRMRLEPTQTEEQKSDGKEAQAPAEVTSEWMEYSMDAGLITFHDNVIMLQSGRQMNCTRADAVIEQAGGMKSLFCKGQVSVRDSVAGRTVTGDDALYQVDDQEITFHGAPVIMIGDAGERLEGATLVYDLVSGAARIKRGARRDTAVGPSEVPEPTPSPAAATEEADGPPAEEDDGNQSDPNDLPQTDL